MTSFLSNFFARSSEKPAAAPTKNDAPEAFDQNIDTSLDIARKTLSTFETPEVAKDPAVPASVALDEARVSQELQSRKRKLQQYKSRFQEFERTFRTNSEISTNSSQYVESLHDILKDSELGIARQANVEAENQRLRIDISNLKEQFVNTVASLNAQNSMVESLRNRSKETRDALQQAHVDITQHLNAIQEKDHQIHKLQEEANTTADELKASRDACLVLDEENARLLAANKAYQEQVAADARTLTEYEKENGEWQRIREFEVARHENLQRDLEEINNRLTETLGEKIDLESRLELLMADIGSQSRHFKEQIRAKEDRIYSLASKVEALESKLKVNSQTAEDMKSENVELTKMIASNDERLLSLKARNEEIKRNHNEDREKLFDAVNRISELDVRVTTLISDLERAKVENNEYNMLVQKLTAENKMLREQMVEDAASKEMAAIKERASAKSEDVKSSDDKVVKMHPKRTA